VCRPPGKDCQRAKAVTGEAAQQRERRSGLGHSRRRRRILTFDSEPAHRSRPPLLQRGALDSPRGRSLREGPPEAAIYVFDNNSGDQTGQIAREAGAEVVDSPLQGKGNVIQHMARIIDADTYLMVDGDDTYRADAAPELIERFRRDKLDMLVATRLVEFERGSFRILHRFGNRVISGLVSVLFRQKLDNVLSGYRVLSRTFVDLVYVYHVPRAILAAGLAVLSLISLTAGLILDTVVRFHEESVKFWKQPLDQRK